MKRPAEAREWSLSVRRTARYFTLGTVDADADDCWYVCHGYGQRAAGFLDGFTSIAAPHRIIVAPEGLSRFYVSGETGPVGASWMTREARESEIEDYIGLLDAVHADVSARTNGAAVAVTLLGFSQGTATVCRWVAHGAVVPARVILWGGGLLPDAELSEVAGRLAKVPFTLVVGDRDTYVDPATLEREIDRFRSARIGCEVVTFDGGHRLDDAVLERLARR